MKQSNTELIGKTIIVKKSNYELKYLVNDVKFSKFYGADFIIGVVTEATGSSPYQINEIFSITENELRVGKYPITSKL